MGYLSNNLHIDFTNNKKVYARLYKVILRYAYTFLVFYISICKKGL